MTTDGYVIPQDGDEANHASAPRRADGREPPSPGLLPEARAAPRVELSVSHGRKNQAHAERIWCRRRSAVPRRAGRRARRDRAARPPVPHRDQSWSSTSGGSGRGSSRRSTSSRRRSPLGVTLAGDGSGGGAAGAPAQGQGLSIDMARTFAEPSRANGRRSGLRTWKVQSTMRLRSRSASPKSIRVLLFRARHRLAGLMKKKGLGAGS